MKTLYWAWLALIADLGVFIGPLPLEHSLGAVLTVIGLHASACAALGTVAWLMLPRRYRSRPILAWLLMFDFAFIAPVIGALSLLLVVHLTLRREEDDDAQALPRSVELPEYNIQSKVANRTAQGSARARLTSKVPDNVRLQSLMSLQAVSRRVANPILEDLLADKTDDVRLIAFGMLDSEEKKISIHISRERQNLAREMTTVQRYDILRHLAELHWELIYASLAQGELRRHILSEARRYADEAMGLEDVEHDSGVLVLCGRIRLEQGELDGAEDYFQEAIALGQPEASALPYLAEIYFRRRDFGEVDQIMQRLARLHLAASTKAVVELWTERNMLDNFRDRNLLPHI
ncbi:MAG TPA: hypothetical protein VGN52_01635 [Burkholderiales bacterium]